jgi:hypothetical protein
LDNIDFNSVIFGWGNQTINPIIDEIPPTRIKPVAYSFDDCSKFILSEEDEAKQVINVINLSQFIRNWFGESIVIE